MQEIYTFIVSQEIYNLVIMLFIIGWGVPFGLHNWVMWFCYLFSRKIIRQSDTGKVLDALWLVAVFWIVIIFFK
ncbi:hypothetical protein [Aeromonas phage 4L372D]|uniref:Uncharacterized protein n=1 Tax=Aeromonas phage 4L372D TaxID=2588518 RepID=A0A5B9N6U1_9CAUD|nr:hypothetical protein HWC27_gp041 [Aeromonas phage 4L372D]QEG08505.1 hypothetical protein [Aeromonas phage 4L372D]